MSFWQLRVAEKTDIIWTHEYINRELLEHSQGTRRQRRHERVALEIVDISHPIHIRWWKFVRWLTGVACGNWEWMVLSDCRSGTHFSLGSFDGYRCVLFYNNPFLPLSSPVSWQRSVIHWQFNDWQLSVKWPTAVARFALWRRHCWETPGVLIFVDHRTRLENVDSFMQTLLVE